MQETLHLDVCVTEILLDSHDSQKRRNKVAKNKLCMEKVRLNSASQI